MRTQCIVHILIIQLFLDALFHLIRQVVFQFFLDVLKTTLIRRCRGGFRLTLDAQDFAWCTENPNPGSLTYQLRLIHDLFDRERSSWTYDSLQDALTGAEMAYAMLQDALLLELEGARVALEGSRAA